MRKKTFSRFLQGAVSMVMVASMLTGCGGSAASTSSSNASAETATTAADNVEYKDTLIVGEYGDSDSLDPQKNVSHDKIERELYEGLLEIDPDTGEFKGCLAESWEHSDDYMTWTFHLRKGVKFASSGKEMTSADVVATFDRLLDKEHPGRYYQNVEFIDTVTAPDDYTVVMTLAHAFGAVEDTLTQAYAPARSIYKDPLHPYTRGLLKSIPKLNEDVETLYNIKGMVPSPKEYPKGCRFCPRCPYAAKLCQDKQPPLTVLPDGRKVRCWKYDEQEGKNFE